jgi:hypothetical protein
VAELTKLESKAQNAEVRELVRWQLPIQRQHLKDAQHGCLTLAGKEDPDETG